MIHSMNVRAGRRLSRGAPGLAPRFWNSAASDGGKTSSHSHTKKKMTSIINLPKYSRVSDLAKTFKTSPAKLIKQLKVVRKNKRIYLKHEDLWFEFNSTNDIIVPFSAVQHIAESSGKQINHLGEDSFSLVTGVSNPSTIPVVVLLGHFNHGKTTLLDALLGSNIIDEEDHQITQVVRSRAVKLHGLDCNNIEGLAYTDHEITIVDTPGQDMFYRMRNYGASVADIGVLVVSCTDGVCPQTEESIGILEQMKVPVVVVLNKTDHADATPERIEQVTKDLREYVVLDEVPIVSVSALRRQNIESLTSTLVQFISTLNSFCTSDGKSSSDVTCSPLKQDLPIQNAPINSYQKYKSCGTVTNQWSNQKDGQVFHVIVRQGILERGNWFSAGGLAGNIVSISRDNNFLELASAGMGVKLRVNVKVKQEPGPLGDVIYFYSNEVPARMLADFRLMEKKFPEHAMSKELSSRYLLDKLYSETYSIRMESIEHDGSNDAIQNNVQKHQSEEDCNQHAHNTVVKSDTSLSMCTFLDYLEEVRELETEEFVRSIAKIGVGDVTPNDVLVAHTAKAPILAYNVGILPDASRQAENLGVKVYYFDKMEDVVNILGGADIMQYDMVKPKRKRKNIA